MKEKLYKLLKSEHSILELVISFFLAFKIINYSLVTILGTPTLGYLKILFPFCSLLFFTIIFFNYFEKKENIDEIISFSIPGIIFGILVIILYIFSLRKTNISILGFVVYFCISYFIGFKKNICIEKILRYVMYFSAISLICFNKLFEIKWYGSVTMDVSYAFLPTIVASILHFVYFYNKKEKNFLLIALYCLNIFYFIQIMLYGERGTILCILVAIMSCWIVQYNKKTGTINKKKLFLKLAITILLGLLSVLLYKEIFTFIVEVFGINSYAINKFLSLSEVDVSNGRFELYAWTISGFLKSPILGSGISSFDYYFPGAGYPHNLFLQLLFDGGIILFLLFMYLLIKGTINIFKVGNKEKVVFWIYLISTSVVYLSFSNNIWVLPALWIFVGFLSANLTFNINKKRR